MLSDMISKQINKTCFAYSLFYFSVDMPPPKVKNQDNYRAYSPTKVANALQTIENGTSNLLAKLPSVMRCQNPH